MLFTKTYAIKYILFSINLLTSEQNTSNPVGFQNVLTVPFWHQWLLLQKGTGNLLNLVFTEKEEFLGMWSSGATSATVTVNNEVQDPGSREESHITDSQPCTSTEQNCSLISWKNFKGVCPGEESRRAGWFSWISSYKLKNGPYQCAKNQAKVAGGLHGQARRFWLSSDEKGSVQGSQA